MSDLDKDYRYMAINDLMALLAADSLALDERLQRKARLADRTAALGQVAPRLTLSPPCLCRSPRPSPRSWPTPTARCRTSL
jgi:hypothetical protein